MIHALRSTLWNAVDGKARVPWLILVPLVGAYGCLILVSEAAILLEMPLPLAQLLISGAPVVAALGLLRLSSHFLGDPRTLADYDVMVNAGWLRELLMGLGIGAVGVAIPYLIGLATGVLRVSATMDGGDLPLGLGVLLVVAAMLCTGFWEELLLRGVFISNARDGLRRWLSPSRALIGGLTISSLVFGLAHLGQPEIPAFILTWILAGVVFGLIYLFSGNLALGIGAHAAFNITANTVFVRTDISGTEHFSALTRITVESDASILGVGGAVEASGFLLVLALGLLWIRLSTGVITLQGLPLSHPPRALAQE
ncbi:CPBP family intramembrane glutamic endopeptidase [Nesterenkonia halotolerans]|uniref:Membrane protease YdiL (CAAX protease family) n=1 Tax=Nesterenkonia halotolerans TaxID=225325 RepID=A0ABR9J2Q6_9MICC|nr:type II CAAX endopeptidase family protein [Nesterenkonia halotolerans]MBE1513290.1 membrane protease YdiL (CAAX protease family) [Nesterenkonia halotolerans]